MDDKEQTFVGEDVACACLHKQARALRRLLDESETALSAKRAKREDKCLHPRRMLVSCGPRDNGQFDYQCMSCGVFL